MRSVITIRPEREGDHQAVHDLTAAAFGREDEARLVERLRQSDAFIPPLSLVAVAEERVVGHVLFSRIGIESPTGAGAVPALALAPLSVQPEFQNRGIGTRLVREGLKRSWQLGHTIVVVVGHPSYYPRFGFSPAGAGGLEAPFAVPDEAFMALALVPGALDGISGLVRYPPPFEVGLGR